MKEGRMMSVKHERLAQYIKQLEDLGYRSFQIDEIIREAVGLDRIDNLTQAQVHTLEEALQDYVSFAFKCKGKKC